MEWPIPASNPPYLLAADHPLVTSARDIAGEVLGEQPVVSVWEFATDGGHFAAAGLEPVGFGPGDEFLAHTVDEHLEIAALEKALAVNEAFARQLAERSAGA